MIEELLVYSIEGKMVANLAVNNPAYQTETLQLSPGFYTVVVRFEDGIVAKKLMVN